MAGMDRAPGRSYLCASMRLHTTLGYGLWCISGIGIALACSATGADSRSGVGGSANGGAAGIGGAGASSGSGGSSAVGGSGNVGVDASTKDSGDDPDAPCQSVTAKASKPAVDIVWIVDNSCSMADEIAKVRSNINQSFVPIIDQSNIDWRVIMISSKGTSSQKVCVDPPLAAGSCGNNPPKFHQLDCTVGSTDSLSIAQSSYAAPGFPFCTFGTVPWNQYARFDATKVFVEVTDDEAGPPPFFLLADGFDYWALNQAQPAGMFGTAQARKYIFHAIVGLDPLDPSKACNTLTADGGSGNKAEAPGLEYQKLANLTGGIVRSICETDWSDIFNTIASGIVNKLSCEYAVPAPGDGGTIDPGKVNVSFTPGGGQPEDVLQDTNAACDQGANGWQWNADQSKILLCGEACTKAKNDDAGQIDIIFGCTTKTVPPPA
jgi:hypothetical protein